MSDLSQISRRAFLIGAGATTIQSMVPDYAAAATKYDYLFVADSQHSRLAGSERNMMIFNNKARLQDLARQGYRSIALELSHDFPAIIKTGMRGITGKVTQSLRNAGVDNPDILMDTSNRFLSLADTVEDLQKKARAHKIKVTCFDPWPLEKMLNLTGRMILKDQSAIRQFNQERFSNALHAAMARRIGSAPLSAAIVIGSKHAKDVSRRLGGTSQIISPSRLAALDDRIISDYAQSLMNIRPGATPA